MADDPQAWATLELKVTPQTPIVDEERLDTFAYLLAEQEGVGGVETRSGGPELVAPLSKANPETPEQLDPSRQDIESWFAQAPGVVVYTTPPFLEPLLAAAQRIGDELGLQLLSRMQERHDDTWRDTWKQFYRPLEIGDNQLCICPSWDRSYRTEAAHTLILDPGRAFGTGLHESTRLCLQALAAAPLPTAGTRLLDLGCGSGILGLSAAALWGNSLDEVYFSDLDPDAVQTARENADLNNPWKPTLHFEPGTASSLQPLGVHWLLANIRPEVLIPDAAAISAHLAPGGHLLLSGILDQEAAEVTAAYEAQGLGYIEQTHLTGWTALVFVKPK